MTDAETYLIKNLRGTRLSFVVHQFVVEIMTQYRNEAAEQLQNKYEKEIDRLNAKVIKLENKVDGRKREVHLGPASGSRGKRVGKRFINGQNNFDY